MDVSFAPPLHTLREQINFTQLPDCLQNFARHCGSGDHLGYEQDWGHCIAILDRPNEDIRKYFHDLNQTLIQGLEPASAALHHLSELVADPRGLDYAIRWRLHHTLVRVISTKRPHIVQEVLAILVRMVKMSLKGCNRAAFVEVAHLNVCSKLLQIIHEVLHNHVTESLLQSDSSYNSKVIMEVLAFTWKFALLGSSDGQIPLSRVMVQLCGKADWHTVFGGWLAVVHEWSILLTVFMEATAYGWGALYDEPDLYESLQVR